MKRIASFFLALALAFSLTACTVPVEKADDGKIQIVATLFPYYDFARAIVGDRADVTLLLSPGREAHSFEPTPLDAVTISESDVFLYNGGEGEYWVDSMLGAAGENIAVIARMMDYVDALDEEYVEGMQGADGHDHDHEHGSHDDHDDHDHDHKEDEHDSDEVEYDEHIWTSPKNAVILCRAVCDAICKADPANEDFYRSTRALPLSAKARRTSSSSSPTASRCSTSAANSAWTTAQRSTAARATPSPRLQQSSSSSTRWRMRVSLWFTPSTSARKRSPLW